MGDPSDNKAAPDTNQRFEALQAQVKKNRSLLTNDEGVEGTGLSMLGLLSLNRAYDQFRDNCLKQLASNPSCTGMFNVMGKRVDVEVNLPQLDTTKPDTVNITISNPDNNASRRVTVRNNSNSI